jgi:ribonucleases P/MRP protein subunit RPP40
VTSGVPQGSVLGPILFLIYINDLDSNLTSKIGKFADDTKLCKGIANLMDVENLRADLDTLSKWSKDWQMEFNIEKCSVIHIGAKNEGNKYSLCNRDLRVSNKERDLGIIMDDELKFTDQCNNAVRNANITLGMIKRTISNKSKKIVTQLYKSLIRPKLEYCVQAWRPYLKKDIDNIERVQHRATKMIKEIKNLSYEERLVKTNLTTLDDRRTRGDLIEVFKMIKGISNVDYREFLTLVVSSKTRGHKFKLEKNRSKRNIRKYFFSQRVVNEWNRLPKSVVEEAESVNSFKNRYDNYKIKINQASR